MIVQTTIIKLLPLPPFEVGKRNHKKKPYMRLSTGHKIVRNSKKVLASPRGQLKNLL